MSERHPIEKERGIRIVGSLRLDHSTIFAVVLVVILLVLLQIVPFGIWLGITFLAAAFWGLLVYVPVSRDGKPLLAILYRRANFDLGQNEFFDKRVERGENFELTKRAKREFAKRLGKLELVPFEISGQKLCIYDDKRDETYTFVVYVKISSLFNASSQEREYRTEAFSKLLDVVKKHEFYRFSWQVQVLPGEALNLRSERETMLKVNDLVNNKSDKVHQFIDAYEQKIMELSSERVVSLRFTVKKDDPRIRHARKKTKITTGEFLYNLVGQLADEVGLTDSLANNPFGISQVDAHTYNESVMDIGLLLDQVSKLPLVREMRKTGILEQSDKQIDEKLGLPTVCGFEANHAWLGETVHMSFFIESLSEYGLTPTEFLWLMNLSNEEGQSAKVIPLTVTAVYQPVSRSSTSRISRFNRNTTSSIIADKQLAGSAVDADLQREAELAKQKTIRLASSRSESLRMRVYVSLQGSSVEEVTANAEILRSTAARNNCSVQGLTLRQYEGVSVVLPLGRGLAALNFKGVFK